MDSTGHLVGISYYNRKIMLITIYIESYEVVGKQTILRLKWNREKGNRVFYSSSTLHDNLDNIWKSQSPRPQGSGPAQNIGSIKCGSLFKHVKTHRCGSYLLDLGNPQMQFGEYLYTLNFFVSKEPLNLDLP